MIKINTQAKLSVEAIYSALMEQKRKTMAPRFRLPYTPQQVYTMLLAACRAEVEGRYRVFSDTDAYKKHLWLIAQWLTGNSSTFGLLLLGNRGNGKTTIVRALRTLVRWLRSDEPYAEDTSYMFPKPGFEILSAKELVRLAKAYNSPSRDNKDEVERYKFYRDREVLCIDDLGTEPRESMNYGDFVTAAMDMVFYRYDYQLCTIATSNLAPDEIGTYYDERFRDRFREMMTVVNFANEPSFRTA